MSSQSTDTGIMFSKRFMVCLSCELTWLPSELLIVVGPGFVLQLKVVHCTELLVSYVPKSHESQMLDDSQYKEVECHGRCDPSFSQENVYGITDQSISVMAIACRHSHTHCLYSWGMTFFRRYDSPFPHTTQTLCFSIM